MTTMERFGVWFCLLALAGMGVVSYLAANKRIDEVQPVPTTLGTTTTTTTPEATELAVLRSAVAELRAHRGLTGPEVRALVEQLLPAEACPEPPCGTPTGSTAPATSATPTTTTEKRGRR